MDLQDRNIIRQYTKTDIEGMGIKDMNGLYLAYCMWLYSKYDRAPVTALVFEEMLRDVLLNDDIDTVQEFLEDNPTNLPEGDLDYRTVSELYVSYREWHRGIYSSHRKWNGGTYISYEERQRELYREKRIMTRPTFHYNIEIIRSKNSSVEEK